MRNLRPALLALLLVAGGPGVPGGFAQAKAPAKKKPGTAPAPSAGKASAKAPTGTANKSSASHSAGHSSGKKNSSKRSKRQPGQKAPTSDRITEIQAALAKDGSFAGAPNGKWGDDTTDAMRKFQSAHGLNPTGKLDAPTLQKLGLGSQTAGAGAPTPPPGAVSRLTSSNTVPAAKAESSARQ